MKYISSSCVKGVKEVIAVVEKCVLAGFKNIELSGGTEHEEDVCKKLMTLKKTHGLNFMCHNYFPAPKIPFVANLASLNDAIHEQTMSHFKKSIDLSVALGATKFGLHAGFYTDIFLGEIGKNIKKRPLYDKKKARKRFCKSFDELKRYSDDRVTLYIENNVIAAHNFSNYDCNNLLMLTTLDEYEALKKEIDFTLLLDIAHLFVSSKTLGNPFFESATALWHETDYVHISDNDGKRDTNKPLNPDGEVYGFLRTQEKRDKTITFEIYDSFSKIQDAIALFLT